MHKINIQGKYFKTIIVCYYTTFNSVNIHWKYSRQLCDINIPNINTVEIEINEYPSENYESLSWSS